MLWQISMIHGSFFARSLSFRFIRLDHGLNSFTADRTENVLSKQLLPLFYVCTYIKNVKGSKRVRFSVREKQDLEKKIHTK